MLVRAVLLLLLISSPAAAQAERCAESFPARVADAKEAVFEYRAYLEQYEKARPAVEWFEAHCRFLTEREIAIRKLDDENAFVCDPKAKGRPKRLTSELVLRFSVLAPISDFQDDAFHGENHRCLERDRAERVGLVFGPRAEGLDRLEQLLDEQEVMCWDDPRAPCVKARESMPAKRASLAAERAKAKTPAAP